MPVPQPNTVIILLATKLSGTEGVICIDVHAMPLNIGLSTSATPSTTSKL